MNGSKVISKGLAALFVLASMLLASPEAKADRHHRRSFDRRTSTRYRPSVARHRPPRVYQPRITYHQPPARHYRPTRSYVPRTTYYRPYTTTYRDRTYYSPRVIYPRRVHYRPVEYVPVRRAVRYYEPRVTYTSYPRRHHYVRPRTTCRPREWGFSVGYGHRSRDRGWGLSLGYGDGYRGRGGGFSFYYHR